jgi:hypothetical protein
MKKMLNWIIRLVNLSCLPSIIYIRLTNEDTKHPYDNTEGCPLALRVKEVLRGKYVIVIPGTTVATVFRERKGKRIMVTHYLIIPAFHYENYQALCADRACFMDIVLISSSSAKLMRGRTTKRSYLSF